MVFGERRCPRAASESPRNHFCFFLDPFFNLTLQISGLLEPFFCKFLFSLLDSKYYYSFILAFISTFWLFFSGAVLLGIALILNCFDLKLIKK